MSERAKKLTPPRRILQQGDIDRPSRKVDVPHDGSPDEDVLHSALERYSRQSYGVILLLLYECRGKGEAIPCGGTGAHLRR
jgi:hypothetical protein